MEIISLTRDKYQEWDDFCLRSDDAWFWHSTKWLVYSLLYRPEYKSTSLSFMVMENRLILAICPLILETREGVKEFAFGGPMTWTPSPAFANLSSKKRERVITKTFAYINELALENEISYTHFVLCPLTFPRNNYLMKQGYIDISLNTQIIDLTQDLKVIHSAMRKGHNYDIDRGLKQLEIKSAHSWEAFNKYTILIHKDPSHTYETRPKITFDMQYNWIQQGNAILLGAMLDDEYVGFSYVTTYKKKAYYSSACNDHNYPNLPIAHALTWGAIEWLKEHDFKYYELGWQQYGNLPYDLPSKKEIEISFFKRGFGGQAYPLFRGEKYYSKDYYTKVNLERVNRYAKELEK